MINVKTHTKDQILSMIQGNWYGSGDSCDLVIIGDREHSNKSFKSGMPISLQIQPNGYYSISLTGSKCFIYLGFITNLTESELIVSVPPSDKQSFKMEECDLFTFKRMNS